MGYNDEGGVMPSISGLPQVPSGEELPKTEHTSASKTYNNRALPSSHSTKEGSEVSSSNSTSWLPKGFSELRDQTVTLVIMDALAAIYQKLRGR